MIDLYHRKIFTSRQAMYLFFQTVHDLIVGQGSFSWHFHIEDQVGSGRTFGHAEVVHAKVFIQRLYHLFHFLLHFQNFLIVCHDRIHVDRCGTVQFFLKFMFDMVDLLVDVLNISVHSNLRVERDHSSSRTVIMDDQIVHTIDQ